ncbi:MAG: hypothetical protein GX146_09655 [Myxococcales bacterium]|jgi:hypothetical protein|nr:hypothetical protein [Myxococcales bacterium]
MKKMGMFLVLMLAAVMVMTGCSFSSGSSDDDDSIRDTGKNTVPKDTGSEPEDTGDEPLDTGDDPTDPDVVDTENDGLGGLNEPCYEGVNDDEEEVFWCDDGFVTTLDNDDDACYCRMACTPAACATDVYCLNVGDGFYGICDYPEDWDLPVGYTCEDTCVPRSLCEAPDELTGECNEADVEEEGECVSWEGEEENVYCVMPCLLVIDECPDDFMCEPAQDVEDGSYDGSGVCMPL